jgi:hypothetical protein
MEINISILRGPSCLPRCEDLLSHLRHNLFFRSLLLHLLHLPRISVHRIRCHDKVSRFTHDTTNSSDIIGVCSRIGMHRVLFIVSNKKRKKQKGPCSRSRHPALSPRSCPCVHWCCEVQSFLLHPYVELDSFNEYHLT